MSLLRLPRGGPEQRAIEAGEIDAIIDYSSSNVILLPAARRALHEAASRAPAAAEKRADEPASANKLLASLPRIEYQGLFADLEPLTLKSGQVLHEPGAPIRYVYFPTDSVICLLATAEARQLQVGLVGYEGMAGIGLVLGTDLSLTRALVQVTGTAMRMSAGRFDEAFRQCVPLQRALYHYAHTKLAMATQTVACNCFHGIEQRLARWLLMTSDRVVSAEFFLTQASLAKMLGVRRGTVNEAAGPLQQRGLISYIRGTIRILDHKGLEAASCRCYTKIEGR